MYVYEYNTHTLTHSTGTKEIEFFGGQHHAIFIHHNE